MTQTFTGFLNVQIRENGDFFATTDKMACFASPGKVMMRSKTHEQQMK